METFPWVIGCIVTPLAAALLSFLAGKRFAAAVGLVAAPIVAFSAGALVWQGSRIGAFRHSVGGWGPPLGIDLRVDGLSMVMVAMTSVVGLFVSIYAAAYFAPDRREEQGGEGAGEGEDATLARKRQFFWPLWMLSWASLHALFLSADLFNLYVTLELLGLSSVALVALEGSEALGAAMRYLLVTLAGSMLYLLGVGMLYSSCGVLDLAQLAARVEAGPAAWSALASMSAGMVLKTALFPLHFWLPPAHSSAPTPVSAVLSGLVIKGSFYLLVRLWLEVFADVVPIELAHLVSVLGMVAIVWGSVVALLQTRLKLLVAYSTVAQIGYLFLVFPLGMAGEPGAWKGGVYYALSHACAKGAMFLSAGTFAHALGEDTIASLRGTVRPMLLTFFAFGLAGITLMGLPPSGGFVGKWMIAKAAIDAGQWPIVAVIFVGGLLAAGYVFKVLQMAFVPADEGDPPELGPVPATLHAAPLALAIVGLVLGVVAIEPLTLMDLGDPFRAVATPGGSP